MRGDGPSQYPAEEALCEPRSSCLAALSCDSRYVEGRFPRWKRLLMLWKAINHPISQQRAFRQLSFCFYNGSIAWYVGYAMLRNDWSGQGGMRCVCCEQRSSCREALCWDTGYVEGRLPRWERLSMLQKALRHSMSQLKSFRHLDPCSYNGPTAR